MWYVPYLRIKKFLGNYSLALLAFAVVSVAIRYWPGVVRFSGHDVNTLQLLTIDGWTYVDVSAVIVGAIATVLGLHLASENDGHLEFAWTQPLSRDEVGLRIFGIDIVGLVIAQLLTVLVVTVATDIWLGHAAVVFDGTASNFVQHGVAAPRLATTPLPLRIAGSLLYMTFPLSIYAWIAVLSASLKRNRGSIAALFWPVMLGVAAMTFIPIKAIANIAGAIAFILPVNLYSNTTETPASIPNLAFGFLLAGILLALALVQWRRLEA